MQRESTPSQTIGPFPHEAWRWAFAATDAAQSAVAIVEGVVYDGDRQPVGDAMLEARLDGPHSWVAGMSGMQRVPTDEHGRFALVVPQQPSPGEPALVLTVFARGLLQQQFTAVWLADATGAAQSAALSGPLAQVPAPRRATLLAQPAEPDSAGVNGDTSDAKLARYRWDLHLQGPDETVFFAFR